MSFLPTSTTQLQNQRLYYYIQLAYDHIRTLSLALPENDDASKAFDVLHRQQLERILDEAGNGRYKEIFRPDTAEKPTRSPAAQLKQARQNGQIRRGRLQQDNISSQIRKTFLDNTKKYEKAFMQDLDNNSLGKWGLELYAVYFPIHFNFKGNITDTDWGIYISEHGIAKLGAHLRKHFIQAYGSPQGNETGFLDLAYEILLRHELVHFKIEAFTLNAELLANKLMYVPYWMHIYSRTYCTDDCLEEGLANASALNSRKIDYYFFNELYPQLKERGSSSLWKHIVTQKFFAHQPPGYTNYALDKGPHMQNNPVGFTAQQLAMNYLNNQIVSGQLHPTEHVPFFAFPPNNYFLRAGHLVPIYVVPYI